MPLKPCPFPSVSPPRSTRHLSAPRVVHQHRSDVADAPKPAGRLGELGIVKTRARLVIHQLPPPSRSPSPIPRYIVFISYIRPMPWPRRRTRSAENAVDDHPTVLEISSGARVSLTTTPALEDRDSSKARSIATVWYVFICLYVRRQV